MVDGWRKEEMAMSEQNPKGLDGWRFYVARGTASISGWFDTIEEAERFRAGFPPKRAKP